MSPCNISSCNFIPSCKSIFMQFCALVQFYTLVQNWQLPVTVELSLSKWTSMFFDSTLNSFKVSFNKLFIVKLILFCFEFWYKFLHLCKKKIIIFASDFFFKLMTIVGFYQLIYCFTVSQSIFLRSKNVC